MSDPPRLLAGEASDFERELLASWGEEPSESTRAKVLALAAPAAVAAATVLAAKAGAAASGSGRIVPASLAPKAGIVAGAAALKWALLGAACVLAAALSVGYLRHANRAPAATSTRAPEPPAPSLAAAPAPTQTEGLVAPLAAPSVARTSSSLAAPVRRAPVGDRNSERSQRGSDDALGEQVSALDRARRALAGADPAGALRIVDDYEARFAHGALVEEADVVRIEALLAMNERAAAARAGSIFLAAHPASPHAARVRALLGQGSPADR